MNSMQIIGPLRPLIAWIIAVVAFKWVKPDEVGPLADQIIQVVSALVTLGVMLWSFRDHSTSNQIGRVADMKEVKSIETTEAHTANEGPLADNPKVVPPRP